MSVPLLSLVALLVPQSEEPDPPASPSRLEAWERRVELERTSPFADLEWRPLGPKNCGGRIESIDSPRGAPETLYVGVGSGGVWKSTNGGLTWTHVFAHESAFAVGDVTVDPSVDDTIWVGTGEAHLGGESYDGTGVFKSTDGGATWTNVGLTESARIAKVVVHPSVSDTVYVAAIGPHTRSGGERGVYRTDDGGATWQRALAVEDRVAIIDLVMDPHDPDTLWAAAWDRARRGRGGVFRSRDGGATWDELGGGLLDGGDVGRVALAATAASPGVVYALIVDHSPPGNGRYDVGGALFRSDDGGDTWSRTLEGYVDTYVGWDFCDVMVSPDDADEVYVCGLRLMVSRDGGATFARGGETVFRLLEHPGRGMHLDMHDLWIDPGRPDRVLLGTDGGLYVSMDRARTWLHLNNLPIAEFYTVHLDGADPPRIWGGTQDNASLVAPLDAELVGDRSDDWRYVFLDPWDGGDGFGTFPDPSGDGTEYYEHQNGDMRRKRPGAPVRWGRRSGKRIRPRARDGEPALRFSWNTPFFPSRHEASVLYCATQYAMRSADRGDTWERISDDLTGGGGAITCLEESPLDAARLVSGAGRRRVHVTEDRGANWREVGDGLPRATVRSVRPSRHDEERLFVCQASPRTGDRATYVHVSRDFGRTWTSIGHTLPHEPANVVLEDPRWPGVLYLGTDLGVWISRDDGESWAPSSARLPTVPVEDLAIDAGGTTLVAVTHGLSAFALDIRSIEPVR